MSKSVTIHKTKDRSHTLYQVNLQEHYHSDFGAIQESQHIYIKSALGQSQKKSICLFEMGFGTGLNAYLSAIYATNHEIRISYTSVEKYPLEASIIKQLNYPDFFPGHEDLFNKIHQSEWGHPLDINPWFNLHKIETDILDYIFDTHPDIVFWDAFSPGKQKQLWSQEIFSRLYQVMTEQSILITYSSMGMVKQNLREAGFIVKRLAGPPGKRHIISAKK